MNCRAALLLLLAGPSAAEELLSDFLALELPEGATEEERARGRATLAFLERLRADLDRQLIDARVLPKSGRRPARPWRVRTFRDVAALRAAVARVLPEAEGVPGTHFLVDTLYVAPSGSAAKDTRLLLEHGGALVLRHRLGVALDTRSTDKGVALLRGLRTYLRESPRRGADAYPDELGGCSPESRERMRERVNGNRFPTLQTLFFADDRSYNADREGLETPAALLVAFLLRTDAPTFWKLLASYRGRGATSDGRAEWKGFLKAYRKLGDREALDARLRAFILAAD
jgi:hypothetical protein